jgi:proteasome accessory factor A
VVLKVDELELRAAPVQRLAVAAASGASVIFDVGRDSLQRVPTMEPLRGTKAHVGELLDACDTAAELVDRLTGAR